MHPVIPTCRIARLANDFAPHILRYVAARGAGGPEAFRGELRRQSLRWAGASEYERNVALNNVITELVKTDALEMLISGEDVTFDAGRQFHDDEVRLLPLSPGEVW